MPSIDSIDQSERRLHIPLVWSTQCSESFIEGVYDSRLFKLNSLFLRALLGQGESADPLPAEIAADSNTDGSDKKFASCK